MTKEITEKEFESMLGTEYYNSFALSVFLTMQKDDKFTNGEPYLVTSGIFNLNSGKWPYIFVVADSRTVKGGLRDFGFRRLVLSTEEMPDVVLDWINDVKKVDKDMTIDVNPENTVIDSDYLMIKYNKNG